MTTLRELINLLEEVAEDTGDETRVLLAFQPSYPLQFEVAGISVPEAPDHYELKAIVEDNDGEISMAQAEEIWREEHGTPAENVVYIVEGGHPDDLPPYGSRETWENVQRP
jgi:hypothetical protein